MQYKETLSSLLEKNKDSKIASIKSILVKDIDFKWVGGILAPDGMIYGIPNKSCSILEINPKTDTYSLWGDIADTGEKKWTGGCYWSDGYIYGFPRGANTLLQVNIRDKSCREIPLNITYQTDHHYGGVITTDGMIYQPPRFGNTIMCIDLNTFQSKEIPLKKRFRNKPYLYYGGICAPNGLVYFFPRGRFERVMVFDPVTEKVSYCKGFLYNVATSSAAVGSDGMIYAFASYARGILKIDPFKNKARIILRNEVGGGCFGTKLAFNGKLYSIPGDSDCIYEFDPSTQTVSVVSKIVDGVGKAAKCAGGCVDSDGAIWCIPAKGDFIYKMEFEDMVGTPVEQLLDINNFKSCY